MGISRGRKAYKTYLIEKDVINDFNTGKYYCEDLAKKYDVEVHTIYKILDEKNI